MSKSEDNFTPRDEQIPGKCKESNHFSIEKETFSYSSKLQVQPLYPIFVPPSQKESDSSIGHASANFSTGRLKQQTDKQVINESITPSLINHFTIEERDLEVASPQIIDDQSVRYDLEFNVRVENMGEDQIPAAEDVNAHCFSNVEKDDYFSEDCALKFGFNFNALSTAGCNTNNNSNHLRESSLSDTDMTNDFACEKRKAPNSQNGGDATEQSTMSYISLAARFSDQDSESCYSNQTEGQIQRQTKPQPGDRLEKDISLSSNDVLRFRTLIAQDKIEELTVVKSLTTSANFMPPQDQSLLATPGSGCSPGHNMNSSPGANTKISESNFQSVEDQYTNSCEGSEPGSVEMQTHGMFSSSQAMRTGNDCSSSDCDKFDGSAEERENGDRAHHRKISSDTIYPWMKESRQNQKKKQSTSVSSG